MVLDEIQMEPDDLESNKSITILIETMNQQTFEPTENPGEQFKN
jgi:hypothetical protein